MNKYYKIEQLKAFLGGKLKKDLFFGASPPKTIFPVVPGKFAKEAQKISVFQP